MPLGNLIYDLNTKTKKTIRTIENTNKKIAKAKSAILFNGQCKKEDILPNYTNIYKFR